MRQYKYNKGNRKMLFNIDDENNYSFGFQEKLNNAYISHFRSVSNNLNENSLFKDFNSFFEDDLFFNNIFEKDNELNFKNSLFSDSFKLFSEFDKIEKEFDSFFENDFFNFKLNDNFIDEFFFPIFNLIDNDLNNNLNENNYNDITLYNPSLRFLEPINIEISNFINPVLDGNQRQNIFNCLFQPENKEIKRDFLGDGKSELYDLFLNSGFFSTGSNNESEEFIKKIDIALKNKDNKKIETELDNFLKICLKDDDLPYYLINYKFTNEKENNPERKKYYNKTLKEVLNIYSNKYIDDINLGDLMLKRYENLKNNEKNPNLKNIIQNKKDFSNYIKNKNSIEQEQIKNY